jgi:uncharacterized membrane protein
MHDNHHNSEHNQKFQRERIALFSDAVFAIAITLLIIEIHPPEVHGSEATDRLLLRGLMGSIPRFVGFFISFWVIGLYWMAHHRLFKYVVHSNQKLLANNLLFLLPIVVMPYSTVFLTEYWPSSLQVPLAVYTVNIVLTGLFSYRLWKIVCNPKNGLSQGMDKLVIEYNTTRALFTPAIFVLILLFSFINYRIAWFVPPILPVLMIFVKRHYKKKYPQLWAQHNF